MGLWWGFAIVTLVCTEALGGAEADWVHSRSGHFEIYTDADERLAKTTLETFEQLREFFLASRKLAVEAVPTTVVLFRRNSDYREYAPPMAAAYYSPGPSRDFIVMSATVAGNAEVAAHELTHLLWQRSGRGRSLPPWLSEGMAEVYSTVRPVQGRVRVGATPERSREALTGRWLPLRYLLTTEAVENDPATRHRDTGALFYAQSWLLTHMLMFQPEYREAFERVLTRISSGEDSATVLPEIYGKPLTAVEKDLYAYGGSPARKKFAEFDTPLRSVTVEEPVPADTARLRVALALLEARDRRREAEKGLLARVEEDAEHAVTYWSGLAELAWLRGDLDGAGAYARKVQESGRADAAELWVLARLSRARGEPAAKTVALLEKVLAADPQHMDARQMLTTMR